MPNCCTECFCDEYLQELIKQEEMLGNCDFCRSKNVYVIEPQELKKYFDPLINLYTAELEYLPMELIKDGGSDERFIWDCLTEDWGVFDDWEVGHKIISEMYSGGDPSDPTSLFLDHYVGIEDEFYGIEGVISDRLKKQWDEFCEEIIYRNRFFPQKKLEVDLISEILTYSDDIITKGKFLFRARLSEKILPAKKMGAPPKQKAVEGRANPKWIPYLYLASDPNTAISEIRPQVQKKVTVGKFKVNKKISVIDLRNPYIDTPFRWGDKLAFVCDIFVFLRMLGYMLSKPVDRDDTVTDYLPTQYLCEFIKKQGFDGILYKSFLGSGHNIVLFDEGKVKCVETKLYEVASIKIESEEVDNED